MKRIHARRPVLAAVVIAFATTLLAAVKVRTQFDETFDFKALHSWGWHPDGAGQVMAASNKYDDPKTIQQNVEPAILKGVQDGLAGRGFETAAGGEPDFYVTYYLLITAGTSAQALGQFLPATTAWGLPPFGLGTQSLEVYETGSLVLDITDRASKNIVWRGVAQARIDRSRNAADREKRIHDGIADLLKQFPPKQKKK